MKKCVYAVDHTTEFYYSDPVRENTYVLNMMPLQDENQKIDQYNLTISPSAKISQYKDYYGNTKHFFSIFQSHQTLKIKSSFQAIVAAPKSLPDCVSEKEWEDLKELKPSGKMWDWIQFGYFTKPSQKLENFLLQEGIKKQLDPLTSLKQLNKKLFSVFSYSPKSTKANSPIEEILTTTQGVCQDYAHVMITIARLWNIPSRYVSGYLYQDKRHSMINVDNASHAWCECYLPSLGWIGFDPTNNILAGIQHIKTALGKDYKDVPPHDGFFKGGATKKLKVNVVVKKL